MVVIGDCKMLLPSSRYMVSAARGKCVVSPCCVADGVYYSGSDPGLGSLRIPIAPSSRRFPSPRVISLRYDGPWKRAQSPRAHRPGYRVRGHFMHRRRYNIHMVRLHQAREPPLSTMIPRTLFEDSPRFRWLGPKWKMQAMAWDLRRASESCGRSGVSLLMSNLVGQGKASVNS
jgi:hypothetical protein